MRTDIAPYPTWPQLAVLMPMKVTGNEIEPAVCYEVERIKLALNRKTDYLCERRVDDRTGVD